MLKAVKGIFNKKGEASMIIVITLAIAALLIFTMCIMFSTVVSQHQNVKKAFEDALSKEVLRASQEVINSHKSSNDATAELDDKVFDSIKVLKLETGNIVTDVCSQLSLRETGETMEGYQNGRIAFKVTEVTAKCINDKRLKGTVNYHIEFPVRIAGKEMTTIKLNIIVNALQSVKY